MEIATGFPELTSRKIEVLAIVASDLTKEHKVKGE